MLLIKEKNAEAAKLLKVRVQGTHQAAILLKVWVCGKITHKNTSLGKLFNKKRCRSSKNTSFRLTFYTWKPTNRSYNPLFSVLGVVFLSLRCFTLLPSFFSIKMWQLPSVIDDYVDHFWHWAHNYSKSCVSSLMCLAVVCLETHNFQT